MEILTAILICLSTHYIQSDAAVKIIKQNGICLTAHNALRARHQDTPPVEWDDELQQASEAWAKHLSSKGKIEHDDNRGAVGENIFAGNDLFCAKSCAAAVLAWYNEIKDYDFSQPKYADKTGHFTQVVWKATTKIGVGIAYIGDSKKTIIVARYKPSGNVNYPAAFAANVKPLIPGKPKPSLSSLDPSTDKYCGPCKDKSKHCDYFTKDKTWCTKNKGLAIYNCVKSCKFC